MVNIRQTKDYSLFHFIPNNREIARNSVLESIKIKNLLHQHPLICRPMDVGGGYYVLDGQNRWAAAKELGLELYYIVDEKACESDIPLHQIQRSWDLKDFVRFYQNEHYQFLQEIREKTKLPQNFIVRCCCTFADPFKAARRGTYKVNKPKEKLRKSFQQFLEIHEICKNIVGSKTIVSVGLRAIWRIINEANYNHEVMKKKCERYPDQVIKAFEFRTEKNSFECLRDNVHNIYQKKENKIAVIGNE